METVRRTSTHGAILALLLLCGFPLFGFALNVVGRDGTHTTIAIPDGPVGNLHYDKSGVALYAAQELQYHIRESTGVTVPFKRESEKPSGKGLIYLGACQQTKTSGIATDDLVPNACIIKLVDGDLFLVGDNNSGVFGYDATHGPWTIALYPTRIGTRFSVYEFLEEHMAVKWLWPGKSGEVIPKYTEIQVTSWDSTWRPPLISVNLGDNPYQVNIFETARWSSREALDTYLFNQAVWQRRHRLAPSADLFLSHCFKYYWNEYGQKHPEFFNLLPDGTRRSDPLYPDGHGHPSHTSMCVSEPGLWKTIVKKWAATRTPGNPFIKLGENDNPGMCTCSNCLAWDESEEPDAERLARAKEAYAKGDWKWFHALSALPDRYAKFYLAVQKEAEKIDPNATVMGFGYANFTAPPRKTNLNDRVIIVYVPSFMFPFTKEKLELEHRQCDSWGETGASLLLRPNYFLQLHTMPLFFARKFGIDFQFLTGRGLTATAFDSLTGQWSTQGPNLYMLARLQTQPNKPVIEILEEYYGGFRSAKDAVREYFHHWEVVSESITDAKIDEFVANHGNPNPTFGFLVYAHAFFTPAVMHQGRALLTRAQVAAQGDPLAAKRVAFLERGLRRAELTLAAQAAFRACQQNQTDSTFQAAVRELDSYRRSVDTKDTDNVSSVYWFEGRHWDRQQVYKSSD